MPADPQPTTSKVTCPECSGTGVGPKEECARCHGFGRVKPEPARKLDWPGETSA